jgi:restriction system protein
MARRNRDSLADDLIGLMARLPWWVGVVLAFISYFGLHGLAETPSPTLQPGQLGAFAVSGLWRALAMIGQYALPLVFLFGAAVSAFRRRRAERLHHASAHRADGMAGMRWQEFEWLVGEYFRRQGYSVTDKGGAGPDGGVDVLLRKGGRRYLVQCKHWRAMRVGVQPVRELYGVMAAHGGVAGGFVVTSGSFTEEARAFSEGLALELIDGRALQRGIRAQAGTEAVAAGSAPPECPQCGAAMVLRLARKGAAPGRQFWGCSQYAHTRCRGTREAD